MRAASATAILRAARSLRRPASRAPGARGFALLAVLWLTTLLAVVAAGFTTTARTGIDLGRNAVEKAKAEALADAGVLRAVLALLDPEPARRWRGDGAAYAFALGGGGEVLVSVQAAGGLIDLNAADDALLAGLFAYAGLDEAAAAALVDAVADFRDPDDLRRPGGGAEDPDYAAAGLPYGARDAPFAAVEELQQVLGVTPELYRRVAPLLTVYAYEDRPDVLTAPLEVLLAMPGVDRAEMDALLARRAAASPAAAAALAGTGPDGGGPSLGRPSLFERLQPSSTGPDALADEEPLEAVDPDLDRFAESLVGVDDVVFTVRAEARTAGGGAFIREAIVDFSEGGPAGEPFVFRAWRRGERRPPPPLPEPDR